MDETVSLRIRETVAQRLSVDAAEIEILHIVPMNGQARLRAGEVLRVRPSNPRRLIGRVVFVLGMRGADGRDFVQWVTAEVTRIQNLVVAKTPLRRNQVISAEDLEIKAVRHPGKRRLYETDPAALVGKRMIRSIKPGTAIRRDLVEVAPMIVRGERITIVLETGGLQISTLGKAVEDGLHGESIKVVNLDSKKIVVAEVVGQGRVRVGGWPGSEASR